MEETCTWTNDYDSSEGECGFMFLFNDGNAKDNGFKYCPNCGKKVVIDEQG